MRLLFFQVADIPRFARDRLVARATAAALAVASAIAALALAPACSYPTDDTPYSGACVRLHPLAFVPLPNSVGVPTDIIFRITFDDYPDPDTVRSDSLLLTTGYFWVPGTYGVDLIGKAAVMRPINSLAPRLGYGLHLRPGLASLAGCPGTSEELEFVTGDGPIGQPPAETPAFASVQAILDAKCGGGCHLGGDDGGTGAWRRRRRGCRCARPTPGTPWSASRRGRSTSLRLVEPGDSARSYLLRKLLPASPGGGPITGVSGQREPPGEPLPEDQLRLIAAWIDGGALR